VFPLRNFFETSMTPSAYNFGVMCQTTRVNDSTHFIFWSQDCVRVAEGLGVGGGIGGGGVGPPTGGSPSCTLACRSQSALPPTTTASFTN
jgi:hypothetical protein